ncbi:expressed unknown protein [Seminavis robusta]|uniref:Uncharacterized protein n=1 Tax=Seminavis robusta TaxID=568900 RepID=A0A9N8EFD4_9STRA|nr:expressed unknown protein [Seminavis robusta]|eukprot:Sro997_g229420.1 n/a (208) ;mRNA; f:17413-18036
MLSTVPRPDHGFAVSRVLLETFDNEASSVSSTSSSSTHHKATTGNLEKSLVVDNEASLESNHANSPRTSPTKTADVVDDDKTSTTYSDDDTWNETVAEIKEQLAVTMIVGSAANGSHEAWDVEKNDLVPKEQLSEAMFDILVERIRMMDDKLLDEVPMEGWEAIAASPISLMREILFDMEVAEECEMEFGWKDIKILLDLMPIMWRS